MNALAVIGSLLAGGPAAVVIKSTAILVSASLLTLVLRRGSAAMRHLVWVAALGGCAALALFVPVAPELAVPVAAEASRPTAVMRFPPSAITLSSSMSLSISGVIAGPSVDRLAISERPVVARLTSGLSQFVVGLWLAGCLVVLGRCVLGHLAVARLVRRSSPVSSPEWDAILLDASLDVGVQRTVELLRSQDLAAPVTSGFINPIILLPADADAWSEERRHIVLVHELAHVARFDYLAQLVATVASALFWFHPFVWFAATRLRAEAENAADDRVLGAGTTGVSYASHLLALARVESPLHMTASVAVGMVRASRLEGRFRAMLDTTRSRAAVSTRLQAVTTSLTLAAMIPLAGMHTVARPTSAMVSVPSLSRQSTVVRAVRPAVSFARTSASAIAIGDSTFDKTIDAAGGERLILDLQTGGSVVLHGWDEPRIRLHATLGGKDWLDTRISLERVGGGVRLVSDFSYAASNRMTRHSFELWVPRHMNVELSSTGGSLQIADLTGEFRGHTGGGPITIERATGHASLTTGGGEVRVSNSDLGGIVSTGGGQVIMTNVTGGISGSSGSGSAIGYGSGSNAVSSTSSTSITSGIGGGVGFGRSVNGTVRGVGGRVSISSESSTSTSTSTTTTIGTGELRGMTMVRNRLHSPEGFGSTELIQAGGSININEAPNGGIFTTGGGRVFIGASEGALGVSTGAGDIELPRVIGDVAASTGAGNVTITVVNGDGTQHSVDVFTGRGRVVLELPAVLDATFELETAYTETNRTTTIESDFPLDRSETQSWDDREGSPRKYVRARGVVGNGRGIIRVRAVNGDIVVRRK